MLTISSVCAIHEYDIKIKFLFCTSLETTTKSKDVMENIFTFFDTEGLQWNKLCGICTDGARAMLGSRSGFQTKMKAKSPQAKCFHCIAMLLPVRFTDFFKRNAELRDKTR